MAAPGRMSNRAFAKAEAREGVALSDMAVSVQSPREDMASTVGSTATTTELGELFEYAIQQPVTVKQGESAMLPFLQQRIDFSHGVCVSGRWTRARVRRMLAGRGPVRACGPAQDPAFRCSSRSTLARTSPARPSCSRPACSRNAR